MDKVLVSTARRIARMLTCFAAGLIALPLIGFASAFLVLAVTWRGATLATGLLALGAGLSALPFVLASRPTRRWTRWTCGILLAGCVAAIGVVRWTGPSGTGGDAGLRIEHFSAGSSGSTSHAPSGLWLPEADLVSLAIGLAPFLDPLIDRPAAARLRAVVTPRYEGLQADVALRDLGSALGYCFRELFLCPFDDGHALAIIPRGHVGATLIFLHGSGGNFGAYWQALAPLARRDAIALVFPTFGAGNWNRPGGVDAVLAAKRAACERFDLAPDHVFLAAVSNGGPGASGALARDPAGFRGVALISAVVDERLLAQAGAGGALRGLPVLLIHGDADDRVPLGAVAPAIAALETAGATVTRRIHAGGDHFLLFSRLDEVVLELSRWILAQGR